jgi:hypothetical protein
MKVQQTQLKRSKVWKTLPHNHNYFWSNVWSTHRAGSIAYGKKECRRLKLYSLCIIPLFPQTLKFCVCCECCVCFTSCFPKIHLSKLWSCLLMLTCICILVLTTSSGKQHVTEIRLARLLEIDLTTLETCFGLVKAFSGTTFVVCD